MSQAWRVKHDCPQCGAPVTLDETDHLLACSYCRVFFYMVSKEAHRYYLPPPDETAESIFYIPYWRFKGVVYSIVPFKVTDLILDATLRAADIQPAPITLGLRPQVFTLKFLMPQTKGKFFDPAMKFEDALAHMHSRRGLVGKMTTDQPLLHNTFFGESISLIYAPYFLSDNRLFDAILKKPIGEYLGPDPDTATPAEKVDWRVKFLPAICPHCGWDVKGDKNSLVQVCKNCGTAAQSGRRGLKIIDYRIVPSRDRQVDYLPFWRLSATTSGLDLESYADLIRVANIPKVVKEEFRDRKIYFWTPAFKVHAQLFLRLARNVTLAQPWPELEPGPIDRPLAAVTLSARDAGESLKTSLAHMSMAKRALFPQLPGINIKVKRSRLVYFPFTTLGQDLVNKSMQISVNRQLVSL